MEDDENDILFFRRALDAVGFDIPVQIAPDGAAAVAWLDQAKTQSGAPDFPKPSLVLLDLNLPRKAGLDVLRWIRRLLLASAHRDHSHVLEFGFRLLRCLCERSQFLCREAK